MHPSHRTEPQTEPGFAVAVCSTRKCRWAPSTHQMERLRAAIRRTRDGVLLSTACLLDRSPCTLAHTWPAPGLRVAIRPHPSGGTADRTGRPPIVVGPVHGPEDLDTLCRWLEEGELHPERLPERLTRRSAGRARWN